MLSKVLIILHGCTTSVALIANRHKLFTSSYKNILQLAPQQLGEFEPIELLSNDNSRRVWLHDFVSNEDDNKHIPYEEGWDLQKQLVEQQLIRIGKRPKDPPLYDQFVPNILNEDINYEGCDTIIMLQHDPVYTLGTASDPAFIHGYDENENDTDNSIPIVRIERGGEVTYHGPGQLTVYPILDLRGYKQDIHWYMRALEEVILLALEKAGVKGATREDNVTGVWVSDKKIAAIGIKARRWVTMHGLAINVDIRSLQNFQGIVPCGLEGRAVTCINDVQDDELTIETFAVHVREALEEIFGISLVSTVSQ